MYCGMDQATALKMVTINPAIALRADKRVGSLTSGKDADFVIWSGNPLSMYSRAEQTWIDGTNYFDLARDGALRKRDAEEKAALTQKALRAKDKRGGAPPKSAEMDEWDCDDVEDVWHAGN
jgi:adenine deaminase